MSADSREDPAQALRRRYARLLAMVVLPATTMGAFMLASVVMERNEPLSESSGMAEIVMVAPWFVPALMLVAWLGLGATLAQRDWDRAQVTGRALVGLALLSAILAFFLPAFM